jgi:cytochrome c-type biogenesis protein CcsB
VTLDAASLARFSDGMLYSAIAVLALALLAHAAGTAVRAARAASSPATEDRAVVATPSMAAVGAGSAAGSQVPDLLEPSGAVPTGGNHSGSLRIEAVATSLTLLGFLLGLTAVVARGVAAGRAPWGNMFEFVVVGSVAVLGAYLAVLTKRPVRGAGVWVVALALLALGLSMTVLYTSVDDLVPVLDSYWLVIHVAAAIVCGGVFSVGAITALLYLARARWERHGGSGFLGRYVASLPRAATLDKVTHAVHVFAFPLWTFAVIAGAIWAENAWGRYWGWDPKETWAFITWVCYAAYLHAQSTAGWRGTKATWFAVAGYAAFLFNFFGVNLWISGLHSYAGV